MTFNARVQGGTGAGRRRPLRDRMTEAWTCQVCGYENARWAANCAMCFERRPSGGRHAR